MARMLYRLGLACARHPVATLVVWLFVIGLSVGAKVALPGELSSRFDVPHSNYSAVLADLQRQIPSAAGGSGTVVLHADERFTPQQKEAVRQALVRWEEIDHITAAVDPFAAQDQADKTGRQLSGTPGPASELYRLSAAARSVSDDGRTAIVRLTFDRQVTEVPGAVLDRIPEAATGLARAGVDVDYGLDVVRPSESAGAAEIVGLAAAGLVLLATLGLGFVAGLPLLTAAVGVGTTIVAGLTLTHWIDLHQSVPAFAVMLGTAVGLDYSLFVISRYRLILSRLPEAERRAPSREEIRQGIAGATAGAGSAVVVAGATVVIALVALAVTNIPVVIQMGMFAAGVVAGNVLVAVTLTPALLSLLGRRVTPRRARAGQPRTPRWWDAWPERWFAIVTRRPALTVLGVVLVLGLVAIPVTSLRLGMSDGGGEQPGTTAYQAYQRIEQGFGAGANGPVLVVATLTTPPAESAVMQAQLGVASRLAEAPDVAAVSPIGVSGDRSTLAFQVIPVSGPSDQRTATLTTTLDGPVHDDLVRSGVSIAVTGQTAANIEISERLGDALPWYVLVVIGLSVLLLTVVFRSVVVPVVATLGYLLSALAAFGAVVAVYQWGWLSDVFQVNRPSGLLSFLPIILIGVLFGLAMDYQMFLVSGMHEARERGQEAVQAVRTGFLSAARVVAAAALIMISVFGGFVYSPISTGRSMGFALGVGVLADAFLVRMTLTPAIMTLLGDRAWYAPRLLLRLLPRLDVEGRDGVTPPAPRREATGIHGPPESPPVHLPTPAGTTSREESL